MSINMLRGIPDSIWEDDNYTPYDIVFASHFPVDRCGSIIESEVDKWYPIPEATRQAISQVVESINNETVKDAVSLLYGFRDGKYYTINETAERLGISVFEAFGYIGIVSNALHKARGTILATLDWKPLR